MTYRKDGNGKILDWAIKQLKQIGENNIEEIYFDFSRELDDEKWAQVDQILMGETFTSLLTVQIWPPSNLRHLPQINNRGILRVLQNHTYQ